MRVSSNATERHLAKVVVFFVGLTGIISVISNALSGAGYAHLVTLATVVSAMLIIWFGRDLIFQKILLKVPSVNPKHKLSSGTWNIHISFEDKDGTGPKERSGSVTMSSSLLGVKIHGGRLLNVKDNRVTMNMWYSDNAELVVYDNHEILYYLYKVPIGAQQMGDGEARFEKIGFVCASRPHGSDIFEGYFRDIRVKKDLSHVREGSIRLVFND